MQFSLEIVLWVGYNKKNIPVLCATRYSIFQYAGLFPLTYEIECIELHFAMTCEIGINAQCPAMEEKK